MSWFPCGALRAVDVQHRRSTIREGAGQLLGRGALRHHLCGFHHSTATQPSVAAQLTHGTFITLHICALFGVRSLLKDPRGRSRFTPAAARKPPAGPLSSELVFWIPPGWNKIPRHFVRRRTDVSGMFGRFLELKEFWKPIGKSIFH